MVGPAVVLLEDRPVARGVPGQLVHALAPLWILVRHESGPHAAVLGRPGSPAVPRLERADGADPDHEVPRILWIDEHGVEAQTTVAGLPVLPRRMVVQRLDIVPRVAAVVAAEQRRGLDPGVDRFGGVRRSRLDVP